MADNKLANINKTFLSTYTLGSGPESKPFSSAVKIIENTRVARTAHVKNIEKLTAELEAGERLVLVREPNNLADPWSVRIETKAGEALGYLTCDCDEIVARLIDGGKEVYAEVVSSEVIGPWNKIDIEVFLDD